MQIRKVGVIGAGQMGNGIAHVCALAGYEVGLNDVSKDRIEAGLATINGNLARRAKSGKISEADRDEPGAEPAAEQLSSSNVCATGSPPTPPEPGPAPPAPPFPLPPGPFPPAAGLPPALELAGLDTTGPS